MIKNEFVRFNDNLYLVKQKYHENTIRIDKVQYLRELLKCDIVLKQNNYLFYCEQIPEAEVITPEVSLTDIVKEAELTGNE
jgi:hypothetical protein